MPIAYYILAIQISLEFSIITMWLWTNLAELGLVKVLEVAIFLAKIRCAKIVAFFLFHYAKTWTRSSHFKKISKFIMFVNEDELWLVRLSRGANCCRWKWLPLFQKGSGIFFRIPEWPNTPGLDCYCWIPSRIILDPQVHRQHQILAPSKENSTVIEIWVLTR